MKFNLYIRKRDEKCFKKFQAILKQEYLTLSEFIAQKVREEVKRYDDEVKKEQEEMCLEDYENFSDSCLNDLEI